IGKAGAKNMSPDGITVTHNQTVESFFMLGGTLPRKMARTEENVSVAFTLHDLTLEMYRLAINQNAVVDTPPSTGVAGFKELSLSRGPDPVVLALLVRGPSAYDDAFNSQFEIPAAVESGEPEVVFAKGEPAGLALSFGIIEATGGQLPRLLMQTAAAL
ncbi:MAG: hypothetical protein ACREH3_18335, partial [Geminicoccales bacterium]